MDLGFVNEFYMPIAIMACLIVGYCIKTGFDFIPNKYIPTILAIVGAIVGCVAHGPGLEVIIAGAFSGLASTGLHQAFTQILNKQ